MLLRFLAYALLAANPIGGIVVAIPFAVFKLHYPAWFIVATAIPLSYIQVIVVDLSWTALARIPAWMRFLERRRSPRVERLIASRGAFVGTMLITPMIGPWLVMAFMRYGQVPQRRVALPMLLGMAIASVINTGVSELLPQLISH